MKQIGEGLICLNKSAEGELRVIESIQDVLTLQKEFKAEEETGNTTSGYQMDLQRGAIHNTSDLPNQHIVVIFTHFLSLVALNPSNCRCFSSKEIYALFDRVSSSFGEAWGTKGVHCKCTFHRAHER